MSLNRIPPALTPLLTFRPRVTVWLWFTFDPLPAPVGLSPAFTFVLIFRPLATVWLWLVAILFELSPAFTFVLIFIRVFSLLVNFEVNCGAYRRASINARRKGEPHHQKNIFLL